MDFLFTHQFNHPPFKKYAFSYDCLPFRQSPSPVFPSNSFFIENILGLKQEAPSKNIKERLGLKRKLADRCTTETSEKVSSTSISAPSKSKRIRTIFTQDQLEKLEVEFEKSQYMVGAERDELAKKLHLTPNQVKVWFQNRRIKYRKQHHDMTQRILAATRSTHSSDASFTEEENSLNI